MDLLKKFKLNRKELNVTNSKLDEYYQYLLDSAKAELKAEDITDGVLKTEYGIFEQGRKSFLEELALCIFPEAKAVAPKPKPESKGLVHCQNKGQWPLEK